MAGKTAEERITAIDEKIAKKQAEIEALEAQKAKALASCQSKDSNGSGEEGRTYSRGNRREVRI